MYVLGHLQNDAGGYRELFNKFMPMQSGTAQFRTERG